MKRVLIPILVSVIFALGAGMFAVGPTDVVIDSIDLRFEGKIRTRETALRGYLDIAEGQIFDSYDELNDALLLQQQVLKNTRYFKSVAIAAENSMQQTNHFHIIITVEDGLTLVPIPYPLPDSSVGRNGWSFGLEVNYDNFIGSMADLYFDGYANIAFGEDLKLKEWKLGPKVQNIKMGDLMFKAEYTQRYRTTEVTDPAREEGLQLLQHYTNHQSFLKVGTTVNLSDKWSYSFAPEIGLKYGFDYHSVFDGETVQANDEVIEDRLNFIFGHDAEAGRVNWIGPLRSGYVFGVGNAIKLLSSFDNRTQSEEFRFVTDFEVSAKGYLPIGRRLNYYTKAEAIYILNSIDTGLGSKLRGVKNSSMYGNAGIFWLNTLGIEIWGNDALHIQLHPFFDTGVAADTADLPTFADSFRYGFGTEVIIMVGSIDLKGKIGYDPISDYIDFNFGTGFTY